MDYGPRHFREDGAVTESRDVTAPLMKALARLFPSLIVQRLHSGRGRRRQLLCIPGTPDILVVAPGGRTLWIETKSKGGRLSPAQREMHNKLRAMGHDVRVAVLWREGVEHVREWMGGGT
jgi:hypothetical protein